MPIRLDPNALRAEARGLLQTAQVPALRFTALFFAVSLVLSLCNAVADHVLGTVNVLNFSLSAFSVFVSLLSVVLSAGYSCYCLRVRRGERAPYASLLEALPFAGKVVGVTVLQGALIGVGLSLFVVPGVVMALSYSQAMLHLCDDPDCGVLEALRRSRMEMRGHKLELAMLFLGFLPLLLVAALAMGMSQLTLSPLFPRTMAGDLLYVLVSGLLLAASQLYLRPWLSMALVCFFRNLTDADDADTDDDAP
ncbi:MAG: DUF975 family protein [Oscillospiraceae bacterium]|nr:DUF975 family protein [Oscillospiraceae bacterium]